MPNKLSPGFYQRDVLLVARELLGKNVYSLIDSQLTGGRIVETEAYRGPEDRGSHAYSNKRTARNEVMYQAGGVAYMYICYGIHDMLNVVTGHENTSHAALIRAIEPVVGLDIMRERRGLFDQDKRLCIGPGALAKSLGLTKAQNGEDLQSNTLWLQDGVDYPDSEIITGPRVGMNFEGPYKNIAWRFYVKGNPFVSRPHL